MKALFLFGAVVAALGFGLSLISHVSGLAGALGPFGEKTIYLHFGIFAVWAPALLASTRLRKGFPPNDFWKPVLRGCPKWMRHAVKGFLWYAVLNFVLFVIGMPRGGTKGPITPEILRGFSGHWMAFYSSAAVILYSAANLWERLDRICPNGHEVAPHAHFCDECGWRLESRM